MEYGLIVAMIVLAMIVGLSSVASTTGNMWNDVSEKVGTA